MMGFGLACAGMGMALGMVLMVLGRQAWKDFRDKRDKERQEYLSRQVMMDDTLVFYNKTLPSTIYTSKGRHVHQGEMIEAAQDAVVWAHTQIEIVWVTVKREVPKMVHTVRERASFLMSELREWWAVQGPDRSEGLTEEVLAQLRGDVSPYDFEDDVVPLTRSKRPTAIALPAGVWTWPRLPRVTFSRNEPQHNESLLRIPMYLTPPRAMAESSSW